MPRERSECFGYAGDSRSSPSDLWKLPCKRISLEAFGDWGMTYFESRTAFCLALPRLRRSPLLLVPSIGGHMSRFAARL